MFKEKFFSRAVSVTVILTFLSILAGCGEDKKICLKDNEGIEQCHTFIQYGIFNEEDKNPNIQYESVPWNIIWGIVLCETIVAPVILFGFYLHQPIGVKAPKTPGAID